MTPTAVSDAELLGQARDGDEAAFTELYVRHQAAAQRLANAYSRAGDPEDLVNESFERVLAALRRGTGPTEAFRAYLFVTLRRLAADRISRSLDEPVDEVPEPVRNEQENPPLDPADRQLVVTAYESLPERWQAVLWQTAVEGRQPRDLAPGLGMSANAAAALAYRAREKLRQAYLQAHLQAAPRPTCEPHRSRLGAYVRDGLSRRDRSATELHLDGCSSCRGLVGELADVNRMLVRSLLPIFTAVGTHLAAGLAAATTGATVVGAGTGAGVSALARRLTDKARSNPAILVGVVLVAALAFALIASRGGDDAVVLPDQESGDGAPAVEGAPPASPDAPSESPADPDDPDDPDPPGDDGGSPGEPDDDEPRLPVLSVDPPAGTPTAPGTTVPNGTGPQPGSPSPTTPPDPGGPGVPPPSPPTTAPPAPPPTQPPPSAPSGSPYVVVVWLDGIAELRVTLHNPTSSPTTPLVLKVDLGGGASLRGTPRGCGLLTTLLSGSSCGLPSVPAGGSRTITVAIDASGSRPTAHVSVCESRLLSLSCDGGLLGNLVAVLV